MKLTLATILTLLRMALALPIAIAAAMSAANVTFALLLAAALSDFLDGRIARHRNEVTRLGAALDPVADKLITTAALGAYIAADTLTGWNVVPALLILLRETLVAGLRESIAGSDVGLPVTSLAKIKTAAQFLALIALAFGPSAAGLLLLWLAAALTVITGAQYARRWVSIVR